MSLLVAVCAALGALFIYAGLTQPASERSTLAERSMRFLDGCGWRRGIPLFLAACTLTAATGALLGASAAGAGGLIAGVLAGGSLPPAMLRRARDKRRRVLQEAWPDAIDSLVSGVRAGMSLGEACAALAERGPGPLRPGFSSFAGAYRSSGRFEHAIARMRAELADPVADRVAVALVIAHGVGGTELVPTLRALADFVRGDVRTRREIQARWSWTVTAARVAAAAPWIVMLLMSTRPQARDAYASEVGAAVILTGAVATIVGYRLMLRAARLPLDDRLA